MNILYLSDAKIPSRGTNSIQIMKMCSAFTSAGADVTLVHPWVFQEKPEGYEGDTWKFYGVKNKFRIVTIPTLLTPFIRERKQLNRLFRSVPYLLFLFWRTLPFQKPVWIFSRSLLATLLAQKVRRLPWAAKKIQGITIEGHDLEGFKTQANVVHACDSIVTITENLKNALVNEVGIDAEKIFSFHDGVDLEDMRFHECTRQVAREKLGLKNTRSLVVYTGRVNRDKGANIIVNLARNMQDVEVDFLVVGKIYDEELHNQATTELNNIQFTGFLPPSLIPLYLYAADILILPSTLSLAYAQYTSPLKLFEYMAAGRPIVATDLAPLREVLRDQENCLLVTESEVDDWVSAIQSLLDDESLREKIASAAYAEVKTYAWNYRAAEILKTACSVSSQTG